MKFTCPNKVICPDESDSPVLNLSAESPDIEHFFEFGSTEPWLLPTLGHTPDIPVFQFCTASEFEARGIPMEIYLQICTHNRTVIVMNDPPNLGGGGNLRNLFFSTPQTCESLCPDGTTFFYTTPFGLIISRINQANADEMAHSYACRLARLKKTCINNLKAFGCVNQPYSSTTQATGGTPPYTYDIPAGMVPPGLFPKTALNGDFLLQGTPNLTGNYTFTLRASDSAGGVINRDFTIAILQVANTIPNATVGTPYSYSLVATGGDSPYTFSIVAGGLPDGLSMTQFGTIHGTPTTAESVNITVKVTDFNGFNCNFDLQMTASPNTCPNWNNLLWGVPTVTTVGAATASFTPNSATGAVSHGIGDCPNINTDRVLIQAVATLSYTGPGCNCHIHADATVLNPSGLNMGGSIAVFVNGNPVGSIVGITSTGAYDVNFAIADTMGMPVAILVVDQYILNNAVNDGLHYSFDVTATMSNV